MNKKKNFFLNNIISFIIIFTSIFQLGLPIYADLIISLLLTLLIQNILVILNLSILLFLSFYTLGFFLKKESVYYRPHEELKTQFNHYEPNKKIQMMVQYGDLGAKTIGNESYKSIHEPRFVEFVTDENGYRNKKKFKNADFVLIGDSMVVGNGTTQDEILSERLIKLSNYKFVNLGYPGSPKDYEKIAKKKLKLYGKKTKIFLFYFEGNDFKNTNDDKIPKKFSFKEYIKKAELIKTTYLSMVYPKDNTLIRAIRRKSVESYSKIQNYIKTKIKNEKKKYKKQTNSVIVKKIGSKNIGFYQQYINVTNSEVLYTYKFEDNEILDKVEAIFFIPTKYRVYNKINNNSGLEALRKLYSNNCIPIINLTNRLREVAGQLVLKNEYVFWRDDTHYNNIGIDIIANLIKYYLDDYYIKYNKNRCELKKFVMEDQIFK